VFQCGVHCRWSSAASVRRSRLPVRASAAAVVDPGGHRVAVDPEGGGAGLRLSTYFLLAISFAAGEPDLVLRWRAASAASPGRTHPGNHERPASLGLAN
jgi:hypothetical protein